MPKIFDIVTVTLIISFVLWLAWWLFSRDWATEHIAKYSKHYENILSTQGLNIESISGYDSSPCAVMYRIYGDEISIKQDSFKTYKLLQKIKHHKTSIYELKIMSDTPFSKLPA